MTGPTASLNVSVPLPNQAALPTFLTVGAPIAASGKVAVGVSGAAPNLATFVDLMIGKVVAPKPKPPGGGLQDTAVPGKGLPDAEPDDATKAFAWLFAPVSVTPPDVVTPQVEPVAPGSVDLGGVVDNVLTTPTGPDAPTTFDDIAVPLTPALADGGELTASPTKITSDPSAVPVSSLPDPKGPAPTVNQVAPVMTELASDVALPAPVAPAPVLPPVAATLPPITTTEPVIGPVAPAPALPTDPTVPVELRVRPIATQPVRNVRAAMVAPAPTPVPAVAQPLPAVLAQIIAGGAAQPALFALAAGRERSADDERAPISATATAAILLQPTDAAALVAQPGGAQGSALDMGRQDWPQKMIDRIEALRDDADAADTSIRLKPAALGRIDVAVRTHADGAISVRFIADQATTRTLLADAQPQLHAAAEARGIKLTGGVDLGSSGGQSERGQPRFDPKANNTNHLAATAAEDSEAASDGRIA